MQMFNRESGVSRSRMDGGEPDPPSQWYSLYRSIIGNGEEEHQPASADQRKVRFRHTDFHTYGHRFPAWSTVWRFHHTTSLAAKKPCQTRCNGGLTFFLDPTDDALRASFASVARGEGEAAALAFHAAVALI